MLQVNKPSICFYVNKLFIHNLTKYYQNRVELVDDPKRNYFHAFGNNLQFDCGFVDKYLLVLPCDRSLKNDLYFLSAVT